MSKISVEISQEEMAELLRIRETRKELTVNELFQRALEEYWSDKRFIQSGWNNEVQLLFRKNISPTFGLMKLSEVTTPLVRKWHKTFEDKTTTGNRSLAVMTKVFNFAISEEIRPQNSNPCALIQKFKEKKRKRFANHEEIIKIAAILERKSQNYPKEVAFIYLLILTGSRPRAIERATRSQLSVHTLEGRTFGVLAFDGKSSSTTGDEEIVILPPQAMDILAKLPIREDGKLVGCKMPRHLWDKIKIEAGCTDLWARDWRRTFATYALSNGLGEGLLGELLNHKSAQTTKIYSKLSADKRLVAASQIGNKMAELMSQDKEAV